MNIQIITSSYPAFKGDPSGTAGLFVQSFAGELASQGHLVVVQPVERKKSYQADPGIVIEPLPWGGGDQELASMNFFNPVNWLTFFLFFVSGRKHTLSVYRKYNIDRILCMWIIPSGLFGYWIKKYLNKDYDVWALGSDIWKIKRIPFFGKRWIKKVVTNATSVFADGMRLSDDVKAITGRQCRFLPSSRVLPPPDPGLSPLEPAGVMHLLFVGRYHKNKGPDLLMRALARLPDQTKAKIRVHVFGVGPLEKKLRILHGKLNLDGFVKINGPIDAQQLANCLRQASFLLIPSRIESIPVVFSDALQAGVPVISTPVGDLKRLVEGYGCGILSTDVSDRSVSLAIERAVEMRKESFAQNALNAFKHFDIHNIVGTWIASKST